jgi:hypothetical protein
MTMPKWRKKRIDRQKMTIFYLSGPLVDFMTDLEETATPEKTYRHRLKVLEFLKELRQCYPGLKIYFKPFPGTFIKDPIRTVFSKELEQGVVRVVSARPSKLYAKVDVVLWDCISTGFAESIQSGVPTLVFQSPHEYEKASTLGKTLNKALEQCGMVFYDVTSGVKNFHRIVDRLGDFLQIREEAVRRFQEAVAAPIEKKDFLARLYTVLQEH